MRRSTMISISILILGSVALLIAAQLLLKPIERDVALADELTRLLRQEGDIPEDYRIKARGKAADKTTLATEGRGMLLELRPAEAVVNRPRGLPSLVSRVARVTLERGKDRRMDWLEIHLHLGSEGAEPFKTLLKRSSASSFERPVPPVPGG